TRISHVKKPGMLNAFRPRFPMHPAPAVVNPGTANGAPLSVKHTFARTKVTPGMYGDVVPPVAALPTDGRACEAPRSSRVSSPVMTLNGRPEATSIIGEMVMSSPRRLKKLWPWAPAGV